MDIGIFLQHTQNCNTVKDWSEAEQALSDTPHNLRGPDWDEAYREMQLLKTKCTCGRVDAEIYIRNIKAASKNLIGVINNKQWERLASKTLALSDAVKFLD